MDINNLNKEIVKFWTERGTIWHYNDTNNVGIGGIFYVSYDATFFP